MKRILVPCDFSKEAVSAFRVALDIARNSRGEVHLVNVVELPVMHDTVLMPVLSFEEALLKELEEKGEKQFKKLKKKYALDFKKVTDQVIYGSPSLMILRYVEEQGIDLIIMGTKGASGLREALIGSNTEKIVRRSPVPVLTVKKNFKMSSIRNIVFPTSLRTDHEDLINEVKALQKFYDATLHIVFINTPAHFVRDTITIRKLNDFVERFSLKNCTTNIFNDPYEESGVNSFTKMIGADMVAMGTHGRKGIAHILSGSLTEDVVNRVDYPVWTYMIGKRKKSES